MDNSVYHRGMTIDEIIDEAQNVKKSLERLKTVTECAVMFVDLAHSTLYKEKHPDEADWLPRLAVFLSSISRIVRVHGRVVKYIGDEIMAVFEGPSCILNAEQTAEQILQFCDLCTDYEFKVKIAIDFGKVSFINFVVPSSVDDKKGNQYQDFHSLGDPQGTVVDRCARIASNCKPGCVLCSQQFYNMSRHQKLWRGCGYFRGKGIKE